MKRSSGAGRRRRHSGRLTRAEPSGPTRRIPSPAVASLLKRLVASGAAYQASSLVAGVLPPFTPPPLPPEPTRGGGRHPQKPPAPPLPLHNPLRLRVCGAVGPL